MNKIFFIVFQFFVLSLFSQTRVNQNKLEEKDGLKYYDSNLFTGVSFRLFPDGELEFESELKDGKPNGVIKKWYETGRLKSEWYYEDGLSHGLHKCYFENGELKEKFNYKNGRQDGIQRIWQKNGSIKQESNYDNGKLLNKKCWDKSGNKIDCG